jgi:dihydrofolate synthase/folylpolyglutamate synthase
LTLSPDAAESLIFHSYEHTGKYLKGYDQDTRDLAGMRALFERAGLPTHFAPAITVTGSKGKGSTSLFSAALLQGMGYRVGLMTSPHFLSVRERMRLDGRAIPETDFARIMTDLEPHITAVDSTLPAGKYLSPTGLFLACALRWWQEQDATALVLEVGRGGRFDDISLYQNQVAAFTPIMAEHLDRMGPTVRDIAWHKAGILKPKGTLVTAPQTPEVLTVLQDETAIQNARLVQVGQHISFTQQDGQIQIGTSDSVAKFKLQTPARYQALNLAVAYGATSALIGTVDAERVRATVERLRLPGRCELLSNTPRVIVDGAINGESARLFRESVQDRITKPLLLVTALPHDKDAEGFFAELAPLADQVIVTHASGGHLHFDERPLEIARRFNANVRDLPDVNQAFQMVLHTVSSTGTVWIIGTQSLVRDALRFWQRNPADVL